MHIEPGVVDGAKLALGAVTAVAAGGYTLKLAAEAIRETGFGAVAIRSLLATILVFCSFEVLPHYPMGVSEVHLILGTTLLLVFGVAPAGIGLALGLLIQGLFFAPFDLPQYGMNVTTLLVPLFGIAALAKRIIPAGTAYVDLGYADVLKLSFAYQGGVIAWVAFWVLWGEGFSATTFAGIASFGAAYILVVVVEPLVDLAVLAAAKRLHALKGSAFVTHRLHHAA